MEEGTTVVIGISGLQKGGVSLGMNFFVTQSQSLSQTLDGTQEKGVTLGTPIAMMVHNQDSVGSVLCWVATSEDTFVFVFMNMYLQHI